MKILLTTIAAIIIMPFSLNAQTIIRRIDINIEKCKEIKEKIKFAETQEDSKEELSILKTDLFSTISVTETLIKVRSAEINQDLDKLSKNYEEKKSEIIKDYIDSLQEELAKYKNILETVLKKS